MSYTSEQFTTRLNNLEDSQESITKASQWLLTHDKYAEDISNTWKQYMLQSTSNTRRKLLGIYLVNHVVQEAKRKRLNQFREFLGPAVQDVLSNIFETFPSDLRNKVKRVCNIWQERAIFSQKVMDQIMKTAKQQQQLQSTTKVPIKLQPLAELYKKMAKYEETLQAAKLRFDSAIASSDVQGYQNLLKMAGTITSTSQECNNLKKESITLLQKLIDDENSAIEANQIIADEAQMMISARDPVNLNQADENQDVLPTYNEDQSDDDSDASDKEVENTNEKSSISNSADTLKRLLEEASNIDNKRQKVEQEVESTEDSKTPVPTFEPTETVEGNNDDNKNDADDNNNSNGEYRPEQQSEAVSSSIQDLLSRLAS